MEKGKTLITIEAEIDASLAKVWESWTQPNHICKWNFASDDWHCPTAKVDLRVGGKFVYRMEAKDRSTGFDFAGIYTDVRVYRQINYQLTDGRLVEIRFATKDGLTLISQNFEAEEINSPALQRAGWQLILDNFKKYVETS